jgi:hypothetical protein
MIHCISEYTVTILIATQGRRREVKGSYLKRRETSSHPWVAFREVELMSKNS